MDLSIETPRWFVPLLSPARYKGVWGGRSSGKSHAFAEYVLARCVAAKTNVVCVREIQRSLQDSVKRLFEAKIQSHGLGQLFDVQEAKIHAPHGGVIIFQGLRDHTAESIKSLEDFDIAWVEEAQALTARSLSILRPTIRKPGSELLFSWNPTRKNDAVDVMLRGDSLPTGAIVVEANWRDNPWLSAEVEQERKDCLRSDADSYDHIWEGKYITSVAGAYYAASLTLCRAQGRISKVAADPLLRLRAFLDIGGTGRQADAFTMWIAQFVGKEVRVLDYYESVGQPIQAHLAWLHERGYTPDKLDMWLPHDGDTHDRVYDVSYASALRAARYDVSVVPNQGKGAAMARINAARRMFPAVWINESTTRPGVEALGWYHEKRDDVRDIGLGPDHDFASHAADGWGLLAVVYEDAARPRGPPARRKRGSAMTA